MRPLRWIPLVLLALASPPTEAEAGGRAAKRPPQAVVTAREVARDVARSPRGEVARRRGGTLWVGTRNSRSSPGAIRVTQTRGKENFRTFEFRGGDLVRVEVVDLKRSTERVFEGRSLATYLGQPADGSRPAKRRPDARPKGATAKRGK